MPHDLASWFAELEPPAGQPDTTTEQGRREAAFCCPTPAPASAPDALVLPWCGDGQDELAGPLHPGSEGLPLLCRGCRELVQGCCRPRGEAVPTDASAGRCGDFQPSDGVTVGRCWLWRVTLAGGRLVWFMSLPPVSQTDALRWAQQHHGEHVQGVHPVPGAVELPPLP